MLAGVLTQPFLQRLDVAALGAALPPLLVIGAVVSESRAGAAAGPDTIALELAFPADHAGEALGLGDAGIVWVRIARRGVVVVRAVLVAAVARRAVVRGFGHGEGLAMMDGAADGVSLLVALEKFSRIHPYRFPSFQKALALLPSTREGWVILVGRQGRASARTERRDEEGRGKREGEKGK